MLWYELLRAVGAPGAAAGVAAKFLAKLFFLLSKLLFFQARYSVNIYNGRVRQSPKATPSQCPPSPRNRRPPTALKSTAVD